ncbi:MAG TPA: DUF1343 domain-containing protein [Thermodesulfovibrionales bacterium]|nr:DUF1343 domain-containing protein [Thermodesulfovibrionales bacterium]
MSVKTGLDLFEKHWPKRFRGARVGLVVHPASVNRNLDHAADLFLQSTRCRLTALFGPQHGIRGETQDNMVEWKGFRDGKRGLPVFSLYGATRQPRPSVLKDLDLIVIDLQDVGSRYYTFIWTMDLCMQACIEEGKPVVVLDRPNPLSGAVIEGTVLNPHYASFVGNRPLPVRHGMTVGEIAWYLKDEFYPSLDLHIISMERWKRKMWFDDTALPWVMPSPNMPTLDSATVYPGACLLEGTLLSEGRGTTRPFEIFGAPFIDPDALIKELKQFGLPGVAFRPIFFEPTFQKHSSRLCGGAQIHVTDRSRFRPFKTGVAVLKAVHDLYPARFRWKNPPYEYEREKMPIDILAGTDKLRKGIEKGRSLTFMEELWREECLHFQKTVRRRFLLYG